MKTRTANGKLKAVKYVDEDLKGDDDDTGDDVVYEQDNTSDDEPPPLKKRRQSQGNPSSSKSAAGTSTNKGKGKENLYHGKNVGKLAKLLEMPVDIFCEVSVYLEPLDLLRLARSTRGFNDMLMSRTSKRIWRTARNYYTDLPDCPADLSEPEYARLLFERDCHACLAPRVLKVDYVLRARLCHRCRSSNIVKGTQLIKTVPDLTEQLLECIPCRNNQWSGRRHRRLEYFYGSRVQALVAKFRAAIPHNLPEVQAKKLQQQFYDRNKDLIGEIVQHAVDVEKWLQSDRMIKIAQGSEAAQRREAALKAKLIELGYSEDDFPYAWENIEWSQIVEQPRDLTPRIWTAVRPKLEICIQKAKTRREERARETRRAHRRAEVRLLLGDMLERREGRDMQLSTSFDAVLELPSVNAMVTEDDDQQEITQAKWDAALVQIEQEMDEYADQARKGLIKLVVISRQVTPSKTPAPESQVRDPTASSTSLPADTEADVDIDTAFLLSPSTFFECKRCHSALLRYPKLLDHYHGYPAKWSPVDFTFNNATSTIAESILHFFQQHHGDDELGAIGKRLQCLRCDENISRPMNWTELVNHFKTEQEWYDEASLHQQSNSSSTVTLHNDHALEDSESPPATILSPDAAMAQEDKVYAWAGGAPRIATCGLCYWQGRKTEDEVALHISSKHLKNPPGKDDIIFDYADTWGDMFAT